MTGCSYCLVGLLLLALGTSLAAPAKVVLRVKNSSGVQRHEVVAFSAEEVCRALGTDCKSPVRVLDSYRQQVPCQLTHDGQLLIEAAVCPHGEACYVVEKGEPEAFQSSVDAYFCQWRADDFTWENDLCAYRAYGPALQRSGERAYGFDVWLKSTRELDVRRRYREHLEAMKERDELNRQGKRSEAAIAFDRKSYHIDHGRGLDCYSVEASLGCGTPAIMLGDSIVMPWAFLDYQVLDNGPLRLTFQLTYPEVLIDGQRVREHRLISLDKGLLFNRITVWYDGLKRPTTLCSGVVVHDDDVSSLTLASDFVAYSDPTDAPKRHNFQIYVATVYPEGHCKTRFIKDKWHAKQGIKGNAVGMKRNVKAGERWTYWFGASWCKGATPDQAAWMQQIKALVSCCHSPLHTSVTHE